MREESNMEKAARDVIQHLEISGDLDRRTAEALRLEIRHLAKRTGVEIKELRIERADEGSSA
jgi:type IV pilus biogenesis protein CpaD/CtpE